MYTRKELADKVGISVQKIKEYEEKSYSYITYYEKRQEEKTIQYLKDKYLAEVIDDNVLFGNILFVKLKIVLQIREVI